LRDRGLYEFEVHKIVEKIFECGSDRGDIGGTSFSKNRP
jgi:hypothetical protein